MSLLKVNSVQILNRVSGLIFFAISFSLVWIGALILRAGANSANGTAYLLSTGHALLFALTLTLLAACLGKKILDSFKAQLPPSMDWMIATALGYGIIATTIFLMALVGWLYPGYFLLVFGAAAIVCADQVKPLFRWFSSASKSFFSSLPTFNRLQKIILILFLLTLAAGFLQALTPPFDYDGLGYHLQNPKLIIAAGKISPMPDNWLTYYPSLYEMLFMAGMVFQSDIAAKVLHYFAFLLLLGSLYSISKFLFSRQVARMAVFLLAGVPILPIWASTAYVDIAWSLFQFLAIGLALIWVRKQRTGLLFLAGLFQGFSLGCKYLAFIGAALVGLIILRESWRGSQVSARVANLLRNGAIFAAGAILLAAPWYVKNLLWTGDPLFPLLLPTTLVDSRQIELWVAYMQSFGYHHTWLDYLTLPFRWVFNHRAFGTYLGEVDMPHPLYLLLPLMLWTRRQEKAEQRKALDLLAILILGMFTAWAINSQQTRFLIPAYPLLSIVVAQIVIQLSLAPSIGRVIKITSLTACFVMLVFSAIITLNALVYLSPVGLITGRETRPEFLGRMVNNFQAHEFILSHLAPTNRVYMPWDARGYYCDQRCEADFDQMGWTTTVEANPSIAMLKSNLQEKQVTHLLLSKSDADYFVIAHDTGGVHSSAYKFTTESFLPACATEIFHNENSRLYQFDFSLPSCK